MGQGSRRRSSNALELHSWLLIVAVVGAALAFGPQGGVDGITVTKATVVVLAAIVAAVVAGLAAVRTARVEVPWHPAIAAVGVLAVAMIVRVVVAEQPMRAIVGFFGRWNGLALYLACFVLFVVAAARGSERIAQRFLRGLVVGGIVVALFALDEAYLRIGPPWSERFYPAGTLGNSNFFGAWVACVLGPALALAVDKLEPRGWRITGAVAVPLLLWGARASGARQALLVVMLVVAVVALAWAAGRLRRTVFVTVAAGAGLAALTGALVLATGALGGGPASSLADESNVQRRLHHWRTSGRMLAEHPLGGIGPGRFTDHVRMFRSVDEAMFNPRLERVPGSAHNAPLQVFAEWGSLVGLAYVAVLVVVLVAMIRELTRRSEEHRLLYAGLAALWLGYLLQSLVSIDTAALIVLGWVSAGLVVAPQVGSRRGLALPWRPRTRSRRPLPVPARASVVGVVVAGLLASWVALLPLRADAASAGGEIRVDGNGGDGPPATTGATELAPWESRYWLRLATVLMEEGEHEYVPSVVDQAYEVSPDSFQVVLNAARVAEASEQLEKARDYYEKALVLEPHLPDLRTEVAEFAIEQGDVAWAEELVTEALTVDPEHQRANELREELSSTDG